MLLSEGTVEEYVDSMNEVKEQEIERLKKELSRVTQEKDEELTRITQEKNEEIARLKALLTTKQNKTTNLHSRSSYHLERAQEAPA